MSDAAIPVGLSRETKIRVDRDGVFWNDGEPLAHPGLQRAFSLWLDVDPESGRYIVRNDINWAFIAVEDAPLLVRGVDGSRILVSDGTWEELALGSLRLEPGDVPYCDVRGGKLPARFTADAAFALLDRAVVRDDGSVVIDGVTVPRVGRGEGALRARRP